MPELSGFERKDLETAGFVGWTAVQEAASDVVATMTAALTVPIPGSVASDGSGPVRLEA